MILPQEHFRVSAIGPVIEEHRTTNLNAGAIWPFIEGQAALHNVDLSGSLESFKQHLRADKQRTANNGHIRLLNCRLYTSDDEESGYVMFNPAFDRDGKYGFYMEDIFVSPQAREQGIGYRIVESLARKTLEAGGEFIKWETDSRNAKMLEWSKNKLLAIDAGEINLDATSLLNEKFKLDINGFHTRPITLFDAADLKNLGVSSTKAAKISDGSLPLVGFITKEVDAPHSAVAATFAYLNYSTFGTTWGINIEPIKVRESLTEEQVKQVVNSTIKAIKEYTIPKHEFPSSQTNGPSKAPDTRIKHLRWHSEDGTLPHRILTEEFGLKARTMTEDEPSTMVLRLMPRNAVERIAHGFHHN